MEVDPATTARRIAALDPGQLALLNAILDTFQRPIAAQRLADSNVVDAEFLAAFGDVLKLHHTMSDDYLDKHRFEAAFERVLKLKTTRFEFCEFQPRITVDDRPTSFRR